MFIQTKRSNAFKLLLLILLIGMNVLILNDLLKREYPFQLIGTKDMIAYWEYWLPPLLALSLLFTPYAWFYDYTLLGIMLTALVVMVHESSIAQARRKEILFWLAAYQGLVLIVAWLNPYLGTYYWFPFGMLLIWIRAIKITNMSEPPELETLK